MLFRSSIVVKLPLPPGCLPTLWQNDEGYRSSYLDAFPGYYLTADAGFIDEDGYLWIMSRTDDIINVAGHRLSTGGMEEILAGHPDVAECAVIGVVDALKGHVPLGLVVLKSGVRHDPARITAELVQRVAELCADYGRHAASAAIAPCAPKIATLRPVTSMPARRAASALPPTASVSRLV